MESKYKVGQKVIYEGLVGVIESVSSYTDGRPCYNLVSELDNELSCTAGESECELYIDQEIDQQEALINAHAESIMIQGTVGRLTDKYYRDGTY